MKPSYQAVTQRAAKGFRRIVAIPQQYGYTLMELMIVLIIVSILAAWAVPQYFNYVRDSRRSDAISSMNRILSQQELFYANNQSTYTEAVEDLGYDQSGGTDITLSEERFYTIQMASCDGTAAGLNDCITLAATPVAGTSQVKDTECFTFNLNSRGRQTANPQGATSNNRECWE